MVSLFTVAFVQFGYALQLRAQNYELGGILVRSVPRAAAAGALTFVAFAVLRRLKHRGWFGTVGLGRYLLLLGVGALPPSIFMFLFTGISEQQVPYFFTRNVLFFAVVHALLGRSEQRLRSEIEAKERSLQMVEDQRELIIEADEATRRSIADFLHDRVQASLVVLSIQLNRIADESSEEVGSRLRSVTEELERLRKFELRTASQRLSPDLRILGLRNALEELQQFYSAAMSIRITVDPTFETLAAGDHQRRNLCAYRVVEQALLNAAVHGRARHCEVHVGASSAGHWWIAVRNDGKALESTSKPGAGSAIIDSWVHSMGGTWQLLDDDGWVRLQVVFPE